MVSYRSWVDFLCIIQSDEKSNKSEFYITDVFELNSCVFFCLLKDKRVFFGLPLKFEDGYFEPTTSYYQFLLRMSGSLLNVGLS